MNESINNVLKNLNDLLKGKTPDSLNSLLTNLGVSKDEILSKLNNISEQDILSKINNNDLEKMMATLSPEQINKIKNVNVSDKGDVEKLYKDFIKNNEDN